MATSFKPLDQKDIATTRTLLHEAIPITGSIVSGTYGVTNTATEFPNENNIKNINDFWHFIETGEKKTTFMEEGSALLESAASTVGSAASTVSGLLKKKPDKSDNKESVDGNGESSDVEEDTTEGGTEVPPNDTSTENGQSAQEEDGEEDGEEDEKHEDHLGGGILSFSNSFGSKKKPSEPDDERKSDDAEADSDAEDKPDTKGKSNGIFSFNRTKSGIKSFRKGVLGYKETKKVIKLNIKINDGNITHIGVDDKPLRELSFDSDMDDHEFVNDIKESMGHPISEAPAPVSEAPAPALEAPAPALEAPAPALETSAQESEVPAPVSDGNEGIATAANEMMENLTQTAKEFGKSVTQVGQEAGEAFLGLVGSSPQTKEQPTDELVD